MRAYQGTDGSVFFVERGDVERTLDLPCGKCFGCRLEHSRQWAIRCIHEAQMHDKNCFITLTYECAGPSLVYRDFQLFMKRLRKALGPLRFYMCGEYGDENGRPHFHACLFGVDFEDKLVFSTAGGIKTYTSSLLSRVWGFGHCLIGDVTFESAAYVARYIMKKVDGDIERIHYEILDEETGELSMRCPEFAHMSLRPGIGDGWFQRFSSDIYPDGQVVVRGRKCLPPKFYDRLYSRLDPESAEVLAFRREIDARTRAGEQSVERRAAREAVARARMKFFKREI